MPKSAGPVHLASGSRSKSDLYAGECLQPQAQLSRLHRHPRRNRARETGTPRTAAGVRDHLRRDESLDGLEGDGAGTDAEEWSPWVWRRKYLALKRFQRIARSVMFTIRWMKSTMNRYEDPNSRVAQALKTNPSDISDSGDLAFNMAHFRATKEIELSPELKQILRQQPQQRTPEQVRSLLRGLQRLPTFNEYPLKVQEKLARVARYHTVPAGRVIIRQGHRGVNFYVIISGRALVHVMQQQKDTIVARLGQGQAFGEVALMQEVTRTASIVSQEDMQLLTIERNEFQEIFSSSSSANSKDPSSLPEHLRYLMSCKFMKHFPVQALLSSPQACRAGCYRRNAVVVADSKTSDDLVVIKSGTCCVMKSLHVNRSDSPDDGRCGSGASSSLGYGEFAGRNELPNLQPSIGPSYAKVDSGLSSNRSSRLSRYRVPQQQQQQQQQHAESYRPPVPFLVVTSEDGETTGGERQFLDSGADSVEKKHVAVQICVMKPGEIFGLSDVLFKDEKVHEVEESASVSLVSNGAECVLLSKSFFIHHANEQVRRSVRESVQPFPSERVFEENYYTQVAWDRYRRGVFRLALRRAMETSSSRRSNNSKNSNNVGIRNHEIALAAKSK